jgi:hypothetical protein
MHMTQQRRRWTDEEVTKLMSMAQKRPSAQIASEIGRPIASVRTKARELSISLRMDRRQRQTMDHPGPRA